MAAGRRWMGARQYWPKPARVFSQVRCCWSHVHAQLGLVLGMCKAALVGKLHARADGVGSTAGNGSHRLDHASTAFNPLEASNVDLVPCRANERTVAKCFC
jgi:hypothetical protein